MRKMKFLILIPMLFFSCKHYSDDDYLQGLWKYIDRITLTFEKNKHYEWQSSNNIYFEGTYVLNPENDSITFYTQYDFTLEFKYKIAGDKLILWNNKPEKKGLSNQIDEVLTFENKRSDLGKLKPFNREVMKDVYMLPADFTGNVYVNYNSVDSSNVDKKDSEVRMIMIPNSGLARTEFKESVISYGLSDLWKTTGNCLLCWKRV